MKERAPDKALKKCARCLTEKPQEDFSSVIGRRLACGERHRYVHKSCRQCRTVNDIKKKVYHDKFYSDRVNLLNQWKAAPCFDCGKEFPPCCMDFDHRPGEEKLFNVGKIAGSHTMETVLAEVAKCDLVCSNCHRIRTYILRKGKAKHFMSRT